MMRKQGENRKRKEENAEIGWVKIMEKKKKKGIGKKKVDYLGG